MGRPSRAYPVPGPAAQALLPLLDPDFDPQIARFTFSAIGGGGGHVLYLSFFPAFGGAGLALGVTCCINYSLQLSAELVVLWGHVLDLVTNSKEVKYDLCRTHHVQRVQRFAEGFFLQVGTSALTVSVRLPISVR